MRSSRSWKPYLGVCRICQIGAVVGLFKLGHSLGIEYLESCGWVG